MATFKWNIAMVRPEVLQLIQDGGYITADWVPTGNPEEYRRVFESVSAAETWNQQLTEAINAEFTDRPFYLFWQD